MVEITFRGRSATSGDRSDAKNFTGENVVADVFKPDSAEAIVEKGDAHPVAFGRCSNPDLTTRMRLGAPMIARPFMAETLTAISTNRFTRSRPRAQS
jgi:2,4-dienoyl-CoA reductase-like NADH-dependent reductase (Old Yellow Enzyme family)